jgi:hypothetical protein
MSGAQADLTFDQTKLQVVGLRRGSAYPADAGGGYPCSPNCGQLAVGVYPQSMAQAILLANATGVLQNAAVEYGTPGGEPSVASGEQEALIVTMQATGAAPATVNLGLANGELVDSTGASLAVTMFGGSVSIAAPTASLSLVPAVQNVNVGPGSPFVVHIHQNAAVASSGMQADLAFDPNRLQVVSLARGSAYPANAGGGFPCSPSCGTLTAGLSPQTIAQAIAEANSTGVLRGAAVYYGTPGGEPSVPAGDQDALIVTMYAKPVGGTAILSLVNQEMVNASGSSLVTSATGGSVAVLAPSVGGVAEKPLIAANSAAAGMDASGDGTSHWPYAAATMLVVALVAGGGAWRVLRRRAQS